MSEPEFPSNSEASKKEPPDKKNIESVVSGGVRRKRKSLRKQFSEVFIAGDMKSTIRYVIFDVALPATVDTIIEVFQQGVEKLFLGESRRRRGSYLPPSGVAGPVQYNRYSPSSGILASPQRALSRQARARHNFDEIVLDSRSEAEEVIDRLFDLVSRYATASVADLYELVGLDAAHTDNKWGWTNLEGAGVTRVRDGYLLDLPEPRPIG